MADYVPQNGGSRAVSNFPDMYGLQELHSSPHRNIPPPPSQTQGDVVYRPFDRDSHSRRSDQQLLLSERERDGSKLRSMKFPVDIPQSQTQNTFVTSDSFNEEARHHTTETRPFLPNGVKEKQALLVHEVELEPPRDRFSVVYVILLIHGIGVLMPWNMFITAKSYYTEYKFGGPCTAYSRNFLSYLGICSQIPNLLLNLFNIFFHVGGSLTKRIVWSIAIICIVFIFTIILAILDTTEWPGIFFAATLVSVAILNSANGIYQNSIYGLAADLPMKYCNAIVLGNNLSGALTSGILMLTIAVSPSVRLSAIYYFLTAVIILVLCFDSYFVLPHCRFYRHYKRAAQRNRLQQKKEHDPDLATAAQGCCTKFRLAVRPLGQVFRKAWMQLFNVFFVFFVTLTVFPAMWADVSPLSAEFKSLDVYFLPVTCFLTFNVCALLGNFTANWVRFPGPRWVWLPVLLRGFFIPFFMFCNYRADFRSFPVFIKNDWAYYAAGVLMSLSSGYYSSLCMMYAPRQVDSHLAPIAGMMAALFLILGINAGVGFSLFMSTVVDNFGPDIRLNNETSCAI